MREQAIEHYKQTHEPFYVSTASEIDLVLEAVPAVITRVRRLAAP